MRSFLFAILMLSSVANAQDFYLAPNGVTCMCPNAAVGASGDPGNGIEYTKRSKEQITVQNASTTCTSGITDMSYLFWDLPPFQADLSAWDTSSVTNMGSMFVDATIFNSDIGLWDVSSVTDMQSMFLMANSFNQPIGDWDVSSVTNMNAIFTESNFNQDISSWDVSNVTNMYQALGFLFNFDQDISNWQFHPDVDLRYFLTQTPTMSSENYDLLLASMLNQPLFNKFFGADGLTYCNVTDHDALINDKGWIIEGGTYITPSLVGLTFIQVTPDTGECFASNVDLGAPIAEGCGVIEITNNAPAEFPLGITQVIWTLVDGNGFTTSETQEVDVIYEIPLLSIPNNINLEPDPNSCIATNIDLGQATYTGGCGVATISNNAPSEFPLGITTVTWTLVDGNGTTVTDTQQVEVIMVADEADVCYVTADPVQPTLNRVFITSDPALSGQNVDFHEVLRETPSGGYETIGFIVPPEESFLDVTSDNNTQAYRYKVQTTDVCGQVLDLSGFHKTILLQSSIATNNSVNLAWNPYIGVSFNTYNIYRSVNGANYELLTSLSSTNTSYNDTSANVVDNFYEYYISIDIASCSTDPFQSFALRSNLEYINPNLVIKDNSWLSSAITFYPNPTSGYLNISINEGLELDGVTIYNALGQKVSQTKGTAQIDVSHIPSGIYYLSISTDQGTVTKTMVRR